MEGDGGGSTAAKWKVMVVTEATRESTIALQCALSNAILEQDELILLQVWSPSSWRNAISTFLKRPMIGGSATTYLEGGEGEGEVDFITEMKHSCKVAQPKISVRIVKVAMEGKDKAAIILSQDKALGIYALSLGRGAALLQHC